MSATPAVRAPAAPRNSSSSAFPSPRSTTPSFASTSFRSASVAAVSVIVAGSARPAPTVGGLTSARSASSSRDRTDRRGGGFGSEAQGQGLSEPDPDFAKQPNAVIVTDAVRVERLARRVVLSHQPRSSFLLAPRADESHAGLLQGDEWSTVRYPEISISGNVDGDTVPDNAGKP